jgi:hypothetical protein
VKCLCLFRTSLKHPRGNQCEARHLDLTLKGGVRQKHPPNGPVDERRLKEPNVNTLRRTYKSGSLRIFTTSGSPCEKRERAATTEQTHSPP